METHVATGWRESPLPWSRTQAQTNHLCNLQVLHIGIECLILTCMPLQNLFQLCSAYERHEALWQAAFIPVQLKTAHMNAQSARLQRCAHLNLKEPRTIQTRLLAGCVSVGQLLSQLVCQPCICLSATIAVHSAEHQNFKSTYI